MQYAQLNQDGTYSHQITTSGNVEWDENNFCTAAALIADGKAEQFRVVELLETDAPAINPITESVTRDGGELVDGQWQYKWRVDALTPEQIAINQAAATAVFVNTVTTTTQARLDDFAKTRNYDGILSACTYASSSVLKFATEGQYCVDSRDATWATLYTIMGQVQAGQRPMPTLDEILGELPVLTWPSES